MTGNTLESFVLKVQAEGDDNAGSRTLILDINQIMYIQQNSNVY